MQFDSAFDDSLIIAASVLPDATVGRHYEFRFPAKGQPKPYVWGLVSGELPEGLELDANGTVSGVPESAETSSFVVKVRCARHPELDEYGWVPHVWSPRVNYLGFASPVPLLPGGVIEGMVLAPLIGVPPALLLAEVYRQEKLADASAGHAYVDIDLWVVDATTGEILWANTARAKREMPIVEGKVADRIGVMVGQTVHRALNKALWNVSFLEAMGAKLL